MAKPRFVYTPENTVAILASTSFPRLKKYRQIAKDPTSDEEALDLYVWNSKISAALLWVLQGLEVTLRNKVDEVFTADFSKDWIMAPCKPPLFFTPYQQKEINTTIQKLTFYNSTTSQTIYPSHTKILASLQWGVWTSFFESHQIFNHSLHKMFEFKNRPKPFLRYNINADIKALKDFRNRIAHHEPILDLHPDAVHQQVLEAINWISPDKRLWVEHYSDFPELWTELMKEKAERGWIF